MKVEVIEVPGLGESEVLIRCARIDGSIRALTAAVQMENFQLTGLLNGAVWLLKPQDVLYIDTVDKATFLYTAEQIYETPLKLYQLEEKLSAVGYFRAGKSLIVNFNKISTLRSDLGGRFRLTMANKELCIVSRQYAVNLKAKLGL